MADHPLTTCAAFDEEIGELVLDLLEPGHRDALLLHATTCTRCQAELHSLTAVADLLPTLAPECEPPVGFESRVLATFAPARRAPAARRVLAAAACLVVVGVLGAWLGHILTDESTPVASSGPAVGTLTATDGTEHGWVMLTGTPGPALTMHLSNLRGGMYRCVLEAADGTRTQIAAWPVDGTGSGDWTVPLPTLPSATRVVVLNSDGLEVAATTLHTNA